MRTFLSLALVALLAAGGLAYWKRDEVVPVLAAHAPALAPYLPQTEPPKPSAPERAGRSGSRGGGGAVPVVLAKAERKAVPRTIEAVGTVQPIASIAIKPRIDSQIANVHVAEGALVKEGALLFSLDARTLQAQLAQAEAQIQKDRVQVDQARRDLARYEDLLAKRISTEVQRDTAATALKVAEAQLAADQAQRANLAATLTYTEIRAPVSGRIGSITAKAGAIVRSGDAQALTTINQIDPIYVSFAVSQSSLNELRTALGRGPVRVEARTGPAILPGTITFIENTVDPATGTVLVKATLTNPREQLWPGAFVQVQVQLGQETDAIAVPQAAVQLGQRGAYVFTIRDGKAQLRPVTVERTQGAEAVVASGVEPGEDVVVDGQLRLVDGATVTVQPVAQTGAATPAPRS